MPDMGVDRQFGILRIAAMRTVPRFVHARFRKDRETLRAAARRPHGDSATLQNFMCATPQLTIHFAPVLEIAGQERAERARLNGEKLRVKRIEPDLLRLEVQQVWLDSFDPEFL